MLYEGTAVHRHKNESVHYQVLIDPERAIFSMPITTVNRSGLLPKGYLAVHPPESISFVS